MQVCTYILWNGKICRMSQCVNKSFSCKKSQNHPFSEYNLIFCVWFDVSHHKVNHFYINKMEEFTFCHVIFIHLEKHIYGSWLAYCLSEYLMGNKCHNKQLCADIFLDTVKCVECANVLLNYSSSNNSKWPFFCIIWSQIIKWINFVKIKWMNLPFAISSL